MTKTDALSRRRSCSGLYNKMNRVWPSLLAVLPIHGCRTAAPGLFSAYVASSSYPIMRRAPDRVFSGFRRPQGHRSGAPPLAAGARRALASPPHAPATPDRQLHRPSPHYPPLRMTAPEPGRRPSLHTTAKGASYSPPKPDPASTDGAAASVPPVPRRLCPAPLLVRLKQTRSGARSCSDASGLGLARDRRSSAARRSPEHP